MSQLQLKFGSYCQVVEDVTPSNSLAACMCGAVSGGQRFLDFDTGKMTVRNFWKVLPMPSSVINCINVLGHAKLSLLVITDCLGPVIGDYTPHVGEASDEDESVVNDLYASVLPVSSTT